MTAADALESLRRGDPAAASAMLFGVTTRDGAWHAAHGMILLAAGHPAEAGQALRTAVDLQDSSPVTLLNLALAEAAAGDRGKARRIMRDLAARAPEWDEPWLRLAELSRHDSDHADAMACYAQALERNPSRPESLVGLAVLRIEDGDAAGAQGLLLRCLGMHPDRTEAWDALGLALLRTGDMAAAESAFAEAQRRDPASYEIAVRHAQAAIAAGHADRALARLEVDAAANPLNPTLPTAQAVILDRLGRREEALDVLEVAVALAPDAAVPALLRGDVLARSPRGAEAVIALRHALGLKPGDRRAMNNLGAVLMRQHQPAEAARVLRELCDRHGDDPVCLCNLANATALLGEQEEAVAIARRSIAVAPDAVLPYRAMVNVSAYHPDTRAAALLADLRALSDRLPREAPAFTNVPDAGRRLRLGLLSGSLRTHPVGWLTIAGLENLDPAAFEIHCLAQNASFDPIARRFRAISHAWHDIDHLDDVALAQLTRAAQLDMVIDLGGYGEAGRLPACARRLAPVQVKWVGMQSHSTGLSEMDWFITDRWETPANLRALYSERLLRLPDGYICYSPPSYAPEVAPTPAVTRGHVTFGCFNNLAKITPAVIDTWSTILHAIPDARLILKTHQFSDPGTRAVIASRFAAHDIPSARLELRGASPHREFLRQYGDIDIVLDPFPYTGGLTTCEALWMGVPTVTLAGEIFAARHSCSHLSNVGLQDWVSRDRESYVSMAICRAGDIDALQSLRSGLRSRVGASPLCDAPRFGRHLGAALRHAWTDWCARS